MRVLQAWLELQYRMHPAIGKVQMAPTYEGMHHPPVARFRKTYNDYLNHRYAFAAFTIIYSIISTRRFRTNRGNGQLVDELEVYVV